MKTGLTLIALILAGRMVSAQEDVWSKIKVRHPKLVKCTCGVSAVAHDPRLEEKQICLCGEQEWPGSRVEITLLNGNPIRGFVVDPKHDPHFKVKPRNLDFTKEKEITIDISLEYTNMNGTISFKKTQIKSIRILEMLDAATLKKIEEAKQKQAEEAAKMDAEWKEQNERLDKERKEAEAKRTKEKADAERSKGLEKEQADLDKKKKAFEIYNKFPESAGWGEDKYKEIKNRMNSPVPQLSIPEKEFYENYQSSWIDGKRYSDQEKEKKKTEETPK